MFRRRAVALKGAIGSSAGSAALSARRDTVAGVRRERSKRGGELGGDITQLPAQQRAHVTQNDLTTAVWSGDHGQPQWDVDCSGKITGEQLRARRRVAEDQSPGLKSGRSGLRHVVAVIDHRILSDASRLECLAQRRNDYSRWGVDREAFVGVRRLRL